MVLPSGMPWWHCRKPQIVSKRLQVMIPTLLPSLERHVRLKLVQVDRAPVLGVSAATIDRLLVETKIAAAGGKRRRMLTTARVMECPRRWTRRCLCWQS
jgi:hypothetical protein